MAGITTLIPPRSFEEGNEALRILITGGGGFIGSHLAERLLLMGHEVRLMDIEFGRNPLKQEFLKIDGDICELRSWNQASANVDLLFHAAAVSRVEWGETDPERCLRTNILGSMNAIKWTVKNGDAHFIFASSREVYGEPSSLPVAEDHPKRPISVYGVSKLTTEQLLSHYANAKGLRYTVTRFSNVYGSERDLHERVIPRFTENALMSEPLTLNGGNQVLDFTFIDDLMDGLTSLIAHIEDKDDSVLNTDIHFASGVGTSVKELAHAVKRATHSNSRIVTLQEREYDVTKFVGDISKAKRLLAYSPRVTLEEGLSKYVGRIRQHRDQMQT